MTTLNDRLIALKEDAWTIAKQAADEGNDAASDLATEFAKRLSSFLQGPRDDQPPPGIQISNAKGTARAILDPNRWHGDGSECVYFNGHWMSPSAAGRLDAGYNVNGKTHWKYVDTNGKRRPIADLLS